MYLLFSGTENVPGINFENFSLRGLGGGGGGIAKTWCDTEGYN